VERLQSALYAEVRPSVEADQSSHKSREYKTAHFCDAADKSRFAVTRRKEAQDGRKNHMRVSDCD
jgi:hypothetical protein